MSIDLYDTTKKSFAGEKIEPPIKIDIAKGVVSTKG
jgi:hypothetical protein